MMRPGQYEGDVRLIYLRIGDDGGTQVLRATFDNLQKARERFDRLRSDETVKAILVMVDAETVLIHGMVEDIAANFRTGHFGAAD